MDEHDIQVIDELIHVAFKEDLSYEEEQKQGSEKVHTTDNDDPYVGCGAATGVHETKTAISNTTYNSNLPAVKVRAEPTAAAAVAAKITAMNELDDVNMKVLTNTIGVSADDGLVVQHEMKATMEDLEETSDSGGGCNSLCENLSLSEAEEMGKAAKHECEVLTDDLRSVDSAAHIEKTTKPVVVKEEDITQDETDKNPPFSINPFSIHADATNEVENTAEQDNEHILIGLEYLWDKTTAVSRASKVGEDDDMKEQKTTNFSYEAISSDMNADEEELLLVINNDEVDGLGGGGGRSSTINQSDKKIMEEIGVPVELMGNDEDFESSSGHSNSDSCHTLLHDEKV